MVLNEKLNVVHFTCKYENENYYSRDYLQYNIRYDRFKFTANDKSMLSKNNFERSSASSRKIVKVFFFNRKQVCRKLHYFSLRFKCICILPREFNVMVHVCCTIVNRLQSILHAFFWVTIQNMVKSKFFSPPQYADYNNIRGRYDSYRNSFD